VALSADGWVTVMNEEEELSKSIRDYLNKTQIDMHFKFIDSFCDIADEKNRIYIEVKLDHFAPAQILHAIAREGIKNAKYLGVANSSEVRLFTSPPYGKILAFARGFDPKLVFTASQVDKPELNSQAGKLLGNPQKVIPLNFSASKYLFIDRENMNAVREVTDKYRIRLDLLINWLDGVGEKDSIKVNNNGWLVNMDKADIFTNEHPEEKRTTELTEFGGGYRRPKHAPIKPADRAWFESLRIKHEDLIDVLHEVDRLLPRRERRKKGVFWTEAEIGDMLADEILELTKPDYVVEPCVGGGSLVKKIVPRVKGTMNDIDVAHVNNCKRIYDGYNWKFTTLDVVQNVASDLIKAWGVQAGKRLLLYTNPPFGTVSTNRLVSRKGEINGSTSRRQQIEYPLDLERYGKGDLFIPIVGRLIEVARVQKTCYLAFFSPFGLFCGRQRYLKLFKALMKDFEFLRGHVFAGNNFHDINKTLPIALSVWKYSPNANTQHTNLVFDFIEKGGGKKTLRFRQMPLLKDGWAYDRRDKGVVKGELVVPPCERFNSPSPKVIHLNPRQGGSEMIPENVIKPLGISGLPDELVYGLWSISVGKHAFGTSLSVSLHPIYFEQAYVHLPDFTKKQTLEILAYAVLETLLKNYAEDRIGFFGTNQVFKFGNERLTEGVKHLLDLCKDAPTYDGLTIGDTFELLRQSKVDATKLRRSLKEEVSNRLKAIGYWNFIPIPQAAEDESDPEEDSTDSEEIGSSSASVGKVRRIMGKTTQEKLAF
jgi:hypothetical protein